MQILSENISVIAAVMNKTWSTERLRVAHRKAGWINDHVDYDQIATVFTFNKTRLSTLKSTVIPAQVAIFRRKGVVSEAEYVTSGCILTAHEVKVALKREELTISRWRAALLTTEASIRARAEREARVLQHEQEKKQEAAEAAELKRVKVAQERAAAALKASKLAKEQEMEMIQQQLEAEIERVRVSSLAVRKHGLNETICASCCMLESHSRRISSFESEAAKTRWLKKWKKCSVRDCAQHAAWCPACVTQTLVQSHLVQAHSGTNHAKKALSSMKRIRTVAANKEKKVAAKLIQRSKRDRDEDLSPPQVTYEDPYQFKSTTTSQFMRDIKFRELVPLPVAVDELKWELSEPDRVDLLSEWMCKRMMKRAEAHKDVIVDDNYTLTHFLENAPRVLALLVSTGCVSLPELGAKDTDQTFLLADKLVEVTRESKIVALGAYVTTFRSDRKQDTWTAIRSGKAKDVKDRIFGSKGHVASRKLKKALDKSLFYRSWLAHELDTGDTEAIKFNWGLAFSVADTDELVRCFHWSPNIRARLQEARWENKNYTHWQQRAPSMIGFCIELMLDCLISEKDSLRWSASFGYEFKNKYGYKPKR